MFIVLDHKQAGYCSVSRFNPCPDEILGLLEEIEIKQNLFKPFFVYQGEKVMPEYVNDFIKIIANSDDRSVTIRCEFLLKSFIDSCTEDGLSGFLPLLLEAISKQVHWSVVLYMYILQMYR